MDSQFWHNKWKKKEIGFHRDEISPLLKKYWPMLELNNGGRILVPLCGKSLDMIWLSKQGYSVLGIELSDIAVESFFRENKLPVKITTQGRFSSWKSGNIQILCGNFFDIDAASLADIAAVYDRASMIALPKDLRQQYCSHLVSFLPAHAVMFLVALEYPKGEMEGPPFSVVREEIENAYNAYFNIKQVHDEDVLKNDAFFQEKGLTQLHEVVYLLRH